MLLEKGHCLQRHALQAYPDRDLAQDETFAATSLTTLVAMVFEGLGVALLPKLAIEAGTVSNAEVSLPPLPDACPRQIVFAWRKNSARKGLFEDLAELLRGMRKMPETPSRSPWNICFAPAPERPRPMPDPQNTSAFWNRVARRYAGMSVRDPASYEATLDRVRAHLKPTDRVLEIGCGTGSTALLLAPMVGEYIATDYAAEMIAIAREKRADANIANLDFVIAQVGDASLPHGPFDVILAFNVLHLLPDRRKSLGGICTHLRADGRFISKTPCLGGLFRVFQPVVAAMRLLGKAPRISFVKPEALEREIAQSGFEISETGTYPARPPSRFIVAQKR